ncbi:MAG: hypothetical protein IJX35_02410, partial [Candidatus Methanomethylophilaceae archaeon]|nr:hypothetical protein [Candidatus Methanomethylophilaceae archaeon]
MKSNKKGVKLLAAVAAIAMVLVSGFVLIGNSSDSDATYTETEITPSSSILVPTENVDVENEKSYIITKDLQVNATTYTTTLYVLDGVTVTIKGVQSAGAITVYAAKSVIQT